MPCTRFYGEPCDPENCCGGRNSKGEPTIRAKRECGGRCGDDLADRKKVKEMADACGGFALCSTARMEWCPCELQEVLDRMSKLETQLAHVLHEIINLREGKDYGERE